MLEDCSLVRTRSWTGLAARVYQHLTCSFPLHPPGVGCGGKVCGECVGSGKLLPRGTSILAGKVVGTTFSGKFFYLWKQERKKKING